MPCSRCGVEFGLFKRESYCRNCGFSSCTSCLSKKAIVPKLGTDAKHAVCFKCFQMLTSGTSEINANSKKAATYSPPAALQKRMELLGNQHSSSSNANSSTRSSDIITDKVLADRLERLRSEHSTESTPSLPQLEERLAKLKGVSCAPSSQHKEFAKPDTRTAAECSKDLFDQVSQEVELESRLPDPDEEIRLRLEKLRNGDVALNDLNKPSASGGQYIQPSIVCPVQSTCNDEFSDQEIEQVLQYMINADKKACMEADESLKSMAKDVELQQKLHEIRANRERAKSLHENKISSGDISDEDNEDKVVDKVIQQFLSESHLDVSLDKSHVGLPAEKNENSCHRKERKLINSSDADELDLEKLPWCVICNDDATLRCYGCDGDLYCRVCFRECHDTFELRDHPSAAYIPE